MASKNTRKAKPNGRKSRLARRVKQHHAANKTPEEQQHKETIKQTHRRLSEMKAARKHNHKLSARLANDGKISRRAAARIQNDHTKASATLSLIIEHDMGGVHDSSEAYRPLTVEEMMAVDEELAAADLLDGAGAMGVEAEGDVRGEEDDEMQWELEEEEDDEAEEEEEGKAEYSFDPRHLAPEPVATATLPYRPIQRK